MTPITAWVWRVWSENLHEHGTEHLHDSNQWPQARGHFYSLSIQFVSANVSSLTQNEFQSIHSQVLNGHIGVGHLAKGHRK